METVTNSTKRKYEDDQNEEQVENKKINLINTTDKNSTGFVNYLIESQLKESQLRVLFLEQQLKTLEVENKTQKIQLNNEKEKLLSDLRVTQEQKYELEQQLKKSKTNEKFYISEFEHLRQKLDKYECDSLPDKEKIINNLNKQLIQLKEENNDLKNTNEKCIIDLNSDLKSKELRIEELSNEIDKLKDTLMKMQQKTESFELIKHENSQYQNRIKDLEIELLRSKETITVSNLARESDKVCELERINRKLQTEVEYLKATQEKAHLYKEEKDSMKKQIEKYEQNIIKIEIEKSELLEKIKEYKLTIESKANLDISNKYKEVIDNLDEKQKNNETKIQYLNNKLKELEFNLDDKDKTINKLQKKIARLNAERNGYKNIVQMYDSEITIDPNNLLQKRIIELETIVNEYKQTCDDENELKLTKNIVIKLNDTNKRSIETQVNLTSEIYDGYEKLIKELKDDNKKLKDDNFVLEMRLEKHNLRGDYDPRYTKIIHFEDNPLQQAISYETNKMQELIDENMKLKERIKILKENQIVEDLTQKVDFNVKQSVDIRTYEELEQKLKDQIILNQRRMDEFERKCKEVLNTFKHLCGFKLTFFEKTVKLTYSNIKSKENYLIFRYNGDGTLSLIESEFANKYSKYIDIYLQKKHSIPAFLAAIIFDLVGDCP